MEQDLTQLTLKELRELYPDLKATSKEKMLELIAELKNDGVVIDENLLTIDTLKDYLLANAESSKKILIKCNSTLDADDFFLVIQHELFPVLNEMGLSVMASNKRRDMHLNGSCYVRLVCARNHDHLKRLMKYTDFKDLK